MNAWRLTSWICAGVIIASVLACIAMATAGSNGLLAVKVTALDPAAEPVDHVVPLIKQQEALPDYELEILEVNGRMHYLGTKPNQSAAGGLEWRLSDPVSLVQIASVRLREKDKLVSDDLAEVQITAPSVEAKNYRFDFTTERSFGTGVKAYFTTPIGMAISGAFFVAVALVVFSKLA
jgi:hypothetical protein